MRRLVRVGGPRPQVARAIASVGVGKMARAGTWLFKIVGRRFARILPSHFLLLPRVDLGGATEQALAPSLLDRVELVRVGDQRAEQLCQHGVAA